MLNKNLGEDEIVESFQKDGIDPVYAKMIIENVRIDVRDKRDFWKLIFMGSFFIVGGFLLNYFSYAIAVKANATSFYLF